MRGMRQKYVYEIAGKRFAGTRICGEIERASASVRVRYYIIKANIFLRPDIYACASW